MFVIEVNKELVLSHAKSMEQSTMTRKIDCHFYLRIRKLSTFNVQAKTSNGARIIIVIQENKELVLLHAKSVDQSTMTRKIEGITLKANKSE